MLTVAAGVREGDRDDIDAAQAAVIRKKCSPFVHVHSCAS